MRFSSARSRARADIPTSSLADIAFLLLIFFLVTTVFDEERGLSMLLPQAEQVVPQTNVLHFIVRTDGLVEVKRGESANVQTIRAVEVKDIWRLAVAENPLLIAAVRTHPDATYRSMIDVLDGLQAAGAERISLQLAER
jgi:biopolymer transport protein ExbD